MKLVNCVKRGISLFILLILFSSVVFAVCKHLVVRVDNEADLAASLKLKAALEDAQQSVAPAEKTILTIILEEDLKARMLQRALPEFPLKLGPGAQRVGEKHILEIQELVKQGKFGSARRYLEGIKPKGGRSGLILSEDAQKLEELIQKAEAAQIKITSHIDRDSGLVRYAEDAAKNQEVKRGLDHLIKELSKGSLTGAGSGLEYLPGSDVIYMRARGGARLYLRKVPGGYEIVAKSSKANQDAVLARLRQLYGKKK